MILGLLSTSPSLPQADYCRLSQHNHQVTGPFTAGVLLTLYQGVLSGRLPPQNIIPSYLFSHIVQFKGNFSSEMHYQHEQRLYDRAKT